MFMVGCQSINCRHEVFDEYGKVVFSKVIDRRGRVPKPRDVERLYDATSGDQLYKFNDEETGYCVCVVCLFVCVVCLLVCLCVCVCL